MKSASTRMILFYFLKNIDLDLFIFLIIRGDFKYTTQ